MSSRFARKVNTRQPKKVVRIYTEGKQTEPNYFISIKNELRLNQIVIEIKGTGDHTLPLVELVIQEKDLEKAGEDTEWWVVFDRDNHESFNESIEKAEKNGINVAYSNESFELWFILHFELLSTSMGRRNFEQKLSQLLGKKYEKNMDVYGLIKGKEADAIRNAKKLEKGHDEAGTASPIRRDPSTTVYKLVEQLRNLKNL